MSRWAGIDEFVAVAQHRSFTRAAKTLPLSTSQLSREIAQLEDRLGQRLFYRTTRCVSLTEAGERFLRDCRRLQEEREAALAGIVDDDTDLQGQLRMTSAIAYGERFIVPIVNSLMGDHPRLSVEILLTDEVLDLVDGGIDLAVRFGRLQDSRLVATRLASRTRLLCAAPSYLALHRPPGGLEELAQHGCLRGTADAWTFRREGRTHLFRPQGRLHCNSGHGVLSAALAGLGLCQLPDFYVRPHLASGDLVELLPQHRPDDEGVWAVYPHRRHLPAKVKALLERLQAGLSAPSA